MTSRMRPWAIAGFAAMSLLLGAATASAVTFEEILNLQLSGVSEETILKLIDVERAVFHLSAYDIVRLKEAGASEDFIRELMDTPERYGGGASAATDVDVDVYVYDDDVAYDDDFEWTDDYYAIEPDDYATVFVYKYYDPFAYYWYPWPRYYVYYSPFWWSRTGFYFGGHWCWDWWDPWGPSSWYCDWHWGYSHHCGPSHTRPVEGRSWHRVRSAAPLRAEREDHILRRAGLPAPQNIRQEARIRVADQRTIVAPATRQAGEVRSARSARTVERPAYRRTEEARTARGTSRGDVRNSAEQRRRGSTAPDYRPSRDAQGSGTQARTPEVRRERPNRGSAAPERSSSPRSVERSRPQSGASRSSGTPSGSPSSPPSGSSGRSSGGSSDGERSGSGGGSSRRR